MDETPRPGGRYRWAPYALAAVFLALYLTLALARWHRMASPSWDVSIFTQAVSGYAGLSAPIVDIKGPGFHQLGDHFSPLLVVLAPFYRLFPSPVTLLVAQAVLIAVSVVPITRVAMRLLGPVIGVVIGASYGLAWGIQAAVDVEFHEYALAVPLLAFAAEAFLRRRWLAVIAWTVPLLLVKEDLGLNVAAMGVALIIRGARRYGAVLTAVGAVGFLLVMFVVIPAFNPDGSYAYWGNIDDGATDAGSIVSRILSLPVLLVDPPVKLETIFLLLVVSGFVALRSPLMLVAVPTILWRFVSSNHGYWGPTWHYSVILMPIAFGAAIDGIERLRVSSRSWLRSYAAVVPAVMATAAVLLCWKFPFKDLVQPETYQQSWRAHAAHEVLDLIPDDATVQTDTGLMSRLVARTELTWVGTSPDTDPEYVLIDDYAGWSPEAPQDAAEYAESQHPGTAYDVVFDVDGYQLAQRTTP
jgi:uncharacterized membrane protein